MKKYFRSHCCWHNMPDKCTPWHCIPHTYPKDGKLLSIAQIHWEEGRSLCMQDTCQATLLFFWLWRSGIGSINHDQERFTQIGKQEVVRKYKNCHAQKRFWEVHLFSLENCRLGKRWGSISLNNCLQEPLILHQSSERHLKKKFGPAQSWDIFFFFQYNKSC